MFAKLVAVSLLTVASAQAMAADCKVTVDSTDQMTYTTKEIVVDKSCKQFTVELTHSGNLPKNVMGHNLVISKTADSQAIATAGMSKGLDGGYLDESDARIIAHTKLIGSYGQPGHGQPGGPPSAPTGNPLVPPGFGDVALPSTIPVSVQRAFLLWVAVIAVNILGTIAQTFVGLSADVGAAVGVGGAVVGGLIGVYFALQFRGGRNWARIVLTVLTGLALLGSLFGLLGAFVLLALAPAAAVLALVVSVAVIAGCVVALVLAWKPEANAYFAHSPV